MLSSNKISSEFNAKDQISIKEIQNEQQVQQKQFFVVLWFPPHLIFGRSETPQKTSNITGTEQLATSVILSSLVSLRGAFSCGSPLAKWTRYC